MGRASANIRGTFFVATMETVSIGVVEGAGEVGALAAGGGPQATVERVRMRLDEELADLCRHHDDQWPVAVFDAEVPLVRDLAPIGRPCRIDLEIWAKAFGRVTVQVCFERPPTGPSLDELRKRLGSAIEEAAVPTLH